MEHDVLLYEVATKNSNDYLGIFSLSHMCSSIWLFFFFSVKSPTELYNLKLSQTATHLKNNMNNEQETIECRLTRWWDESGAHTKATNNKLRGKTGEIDVNYPMLV